MIYIDPMLTTTKNHLKKIDKEQRQGNLNRTLKKSSKPHTKKIKSRRKKQRKTIKQPKNNPSPVQNAVAVLGALCKLHTHPLRALKWLDSFSTHHAWDTAQSHCALLHPGAGNGGQTGPSPEIYALVWLTCTCMESCLQFKGGGSLYSLKSIRG